MVDIYATYIKTCMAYICNFSGTYMNYIWNIYLIRFMGKKKNKSYFVLLIELFTLFL